MAKRGPYGPRRKSVLAGIAGIPASGGANGDLGGAGVAIDPDTFAYVVGEDGTINPAGDGSNASGTGEGPGSAPRSRPAGQTKKATSLSVSSLEQLLLRVHSVLAAVAQTPELGLEPTEARAFAESYVTMQQHYAHVMSAKTIDTLSFMGVVGTIYGTRIVALSKKRGKKGDAKKEPPKQADNVSQFPNMGIPGL